jgi:hypothetical protein
MPVVIPPDPSNAYALQQHIAILAQLSDGVAAQQLNQRQIDLVQTLLDLRKLDAGVILSTVPYNSSNPIIAQIAAMTPLAAKYGNTLPGDAARETVGQLQLQLLQELMASAQMPAALILSTMSVSWGNTRN